MPALLIIAFVIVPLIELVVVIEVGQAIGALWTVLLLVTLSIIGAWLLKREGRRAWTAFRTALAEGRWPGDEVAQGALIIVGGTLLLTPGFFTDGLGLLMLLPPTRAVMSRVVRARVVPAGLGGLGGARRADPRAGGTQAGATRTGRSRRRPSGETLDVEVVEIERESRDDRNDRLDGGGGVDGDGRDGRDGRDEGAPPA